MPQAKRRTRSRKPTGALATFAAAGKTNGRLLPDLERFLLQQHLAGLDEPDRRQDVIHVSEIVKVDWCPRATYLRIVRSRAGEALPPDPGWRFQRENIFTEGDRIHEKWQSNWWRKGDLWGRYKCLHCGDTFWAKSPTEHDICGSSALRYLEVPMFSKEHLLGAHADGEIRDDVGNVLIEVKSIGDGTVRVELPQTFMKYNRKATLEDGTATTYFDMRGLFRDIRKPFPSHLRQGWSYLKMRALEAELHGWPPVDGIVYIYEAKSTQATKEFFVRRNDEFIDPLFDECKNVLYALDQQRLPACKDGRRSDCPQCKPFMEGRHDPRSPNSEPTPGTRGSTDQGRSRGDEARTRTGQQAPGRGTRVTRRHDRTPRPGSDAADGGVHSLGGLLADAAGDGRSR